MFELFSSKTPNKEASPATARQARHTTEKYSLLFSFCARPISFSSNERVFFCGVLPSKYSGRWRGWPQFDFAKEKRNSPQTPLPLFLFSNGTGTEAGGQKFLPPNPLPFCPPAWASPPKLLDGRILWRTSNFYCYSTCFIGILESLRNLVNVLFSVPLLLPECLCCPVRLLQ